MQGLRTCASRTTPHQLNTRIFRNTKNSNMKTEIKTIQQFDLIFLFAPFHRTQVQVGSNHCNWVAMSLCHSVRELWLKLCECWPYYLMILVEEHIWWPMTVLGLHQDCIYVKTSSMIVNIPKYIYIDRLIDLVDVTLIDEDTKSILTDKIHWSHPTLKRWKSF